MEPAQRHWAAGTQSSAAEDEARLEPAGSAEERLLSRQPCDNFLKGEKPGSLLPQLLKVHSMLAVPEQVLVAIPGQSSHVPRSDCARLFVSYDREWCVLLPLDNILN